ncbi:MAG: hypothetical protein ACOYVK_12860 [Bacillota bacterium]
MEKDECQNYDIIVYREKHSYGMEIFDIDFKNLRMNYSGGRWFHEKGCPV